MGTIDENTNDENSVIEEKEFDHVKDSAWKGISLSFKELLDISKDTDREATIEGVKKDISFKGHNAWILIFSVFVASIGLTVVLRIPAIIYTGIVKAANIFRICY